MYTVVPATRRQHGVWVGAVIVALAGCLAWTRSAGIDDAYISYRYAFNLVHGQSLVFNAGERVEATSDLLWVLLLAVCQLAGVALPVAGYLLGALSLLATVCLTYRLAVRLSLPPLVAGVTTMTVALSTDLVAGATMGLEGGLYTALLLGVILLCDVTTGWRSPLLAVAVVALAATRPEGIVVGSALMIVRLFLPSFRLQRDRLVTSIVAFGGVGALELVRFQYYGSWLPMSVTAKRDIGYSPLNSLVYHFPGGVKYLLLLGGLPLIVAAIAGFASAAWIVRNPGQRQNPSSSILIWSASLAVLLGLLLPLLSSGDWMPYARLVVPYLPLAAVLGVVLLRATPSARWALALPIVMLVLGGHSLPMRDGLATDNARDAIGRALAAGIDTNSVVATDVLGRVAFWSPNVRYKDMLGLADPAVASSPGRGGVFGKTDYAITLAAHPAVVDSNDWTSLAALVATPVPKPDYAAIVSASLIQNRIFLLVDPAVSATVMQGVTSQFPDAVVEPLDAAFARWRTEVPNGQ